MLILGLIALATAQDHGHPAVLLPGAGSLEAGEGHVGVGGGIADVLTGEGLFIGVGGPVVTGVVGLHDRVAVNFAAGLGFAGTGAGSGLWAMATPHAAVGARVIALKLGDFRVAPFAVAAIGTLPGQGLDAVVGAGVAAKLDYRRIGFDLSLPIWGRLLQDGHWSEPEVWRFLEAGVSYQIDREMRFRFGMASYVPVISIRRTVKNTWLEVDWLWLISGYFLIQGGVAF